MLGSPRTRLAIFARRCVDGALNRLTDEERVVAEGVACILCGKQRPSVRLAPDSSEGICVQCGPLFRRIRTIHSDADELAHNGYCVLRAHFPASLIDACRTALWPTLLRAHRAT